MLVSDPFQGKGIGTKILQKLIQMGKDEKLEKITASILSQNGAMQQVSQKVGFTIKREEEIVKAEIQLSLNQLTMNNEQ